jgi:hypothetical protein
LSFSKKLSKVSTYPIVKNSLNLGAPFQGSAYAERRRIISHGNKVRNQKSNMYCWEEALLGKTVDKNARVSATSAGWQDEMWKKSPIMLHNPILSKLIHRGIKDICRPTLWSSFVILNKTSQCKQSHKRRKSAQSEVDVMITIFCDFL